MKNNQKIKIYQSHSGHSFAGYLVADKETKFIALNEGKKIELHFPKAAYHYEVLEEK